MRIDATQWQAMGRQSFGSRLLGLIRQGHPEQGRDIAEDDFVAFCDDMRERATRYGLLDEQSAAVFVYAAWLFGESFDERIGAVAELLVDDGLTATEKAGALADFSLRVFDLLETGESLPEVPEC